jgi:hypothetical protein
LRIDDIFWREKMFTAVVWGGKFYSVFRQFDIYLVLSTPLSCCVFFSQSERKNLKSSTVRENKPVLPVFKLVQSASLFDEFTSRAEVEVKGVGENQLYGLNLVSDVFGVAKKVKDESFNSGFRSNRHKNRSLKGYSVEGDFAYSGVSALFEEVEVEF